MADLTILNQSSYTMDALSKKYKGFFVPHFQVIIAGKNSTQAGMIISSISIDTSVEKADSFSFTVANAFDVVQKDIQFDFLDVGNKVEIKMGYVDVLETVFKGYITSVRYELTATDPSSVVVSGMDYSFKLMKGIKSNVFRAVKDSQVASQIINKAGLTPKVDNTDIQYDMIQQVGVSDYQFLAALAERNAYEFFISGQQVYFREPPADGSAVVTLTWGQNLISLIKEDDLSDQTGTVKLRSWDYKTKKVLIGSASTGSEPGQKKLEKALGTIVDNYSSEAGTQSEVQQEAKAIKSKSAQKFSSGEATCIGLPVIRAGLFVELAGMGSKLNAVYYVASARHNIDESGYTTTFSI